MFCNHDQRTYTEHRNKLQIITADTHPAYMAEAQTQLSSVLIKQLSANGQLI